MQNRNLFNYISLHQSDKLITELKNQVWSINDVNEYGERLLNLAIREGMIHAVIWLLYANATIYDNDLIIAIERGHPLIAQILLACGANKQNAILKALEAKKINIASQ